MTTTVTHSTGKKEYKDFTSLRAWQIGNDVNITAQAMLQEYRQEEETSRWCQSVQMSLRDSVVQLMEAFRKYQSSDKLRRYDACLFYINQALYTLMFGQSVGWWQVDELLADVKEYENVVRATAYHFVEKKEKVT